MKKIFFLIIAISFYYTTFSQNQWNQIHPYPTLKNLHDVHFNSEEEGWIIGNGNGSAIMYTNDAGVTWETQLSGQYTPYTSLFFIDENEGWAGGSNCIYHTTDKGASWIAQQVPNLNYAIKDLFFINHDIGWAVCTKRIILKTVDGGVNWTKIMNFTNNMDFESVYFNDEMHGCAVGGFHADDGFIMITTDGGNTWSDVSPEDCYGFRRVTFINSLTGWVCGFGGPSGQPAELHNTTDGGLTWTEHTIANYTFLNDIHFVNQDTGMILDENNRVYLTSNGGISWDSIYYIGGYNMRRMSFWNNRGCYSVGYTGKIIKSTDLGQSWENVGQSFGSSIYNIGFFDSYNGLALAGAHLLYRTENGGYNWELDTLINNGDFYLLHIVGSSGYLLNTNSQMMKTSNGGENWVLLDIPDNTSYYKDLQFVNENTGYLCGDFGVLKKTINGGITWEDKSLSSDHQFTSLQFINEDLGWMIDMNSQTLLKTEDGGDSWSDATLGNVRSMFHLNDNVGYVTTFDSKLFKTVNAGDTWLEIYNFLHTGSVYFIDEFIGWYIMNTKVHHTYDGGITWQDEQYFEYTSIKNIFFLNDNQGWIAGDNGFVATCDFTVDIGEVINSSSPISVFPNPVHEYVNIKQDHSKGKIIEVKLFNIQGQKVIHFPHLSEPKSFNFNISSLQSGVYFIEVTTEQSEHMVKLIVQ